MTEAEQEKRRQENLAVLAELCLMDDEFMSAVYQDGLPCADLTIQILLGRDDIHAQSVVTQETITNFQGRNVRLDIHAKADGRDIDVEIQREDSGAVPERARYNGSMMDAKQLQPGEPFTALHDTYVIFITEKDTLGVHLPICHIERVIEETGDRFPDGSHIIYVDSEFAGDTTPLAKLMHDFRCKDPDDMYFDVLKQRANHFKKTPEGVTEMCKALDELTKKREAEAEIRGEVRGEFMANLKTIKNLMKSTGQTVDKVMESMGIDPAARQKYLAFIS